MVNPAAGLGPQQVVFQQAPPVAQQDVRSRNEQTQPRNAHAANSQHAEHRNLRSADDRENKQGQHNSESADNGQAASGSGKRGSLLDLNA